MKTTTAQPFATFADAVAALPACIASDYDALRHTELHDLRWMAVHEIDLHDEGEVKLTKRQIADLYAYEQRITASVS